MSRFLLLGMMLCLFITCADEKKTEQTLKMNHSLEKKSTNLLEDCKQLVLVVSPSDTAIIAELRKYEKNEAGAWQLMDKPHAVSLGRSGLAWGKGKHQEPSAQLYRKKEGDGKSPAGIFSFGVAFGYAEQMEELKMPYVPVSATIQCIEDSASKYYNQIIDNEKITKDWNTADFMRREDDLYKYGVFVNHNTAAEAEGGSCIFLHLWRGYGKPTAGCTAMEEKNMYNILRWLDPAKNPRLVQLIEKDYPSFKESYGLPDLFK